MRNLFTALKQDTHANHAILENTFPFSMYHKDSEFNHEAYLAILNIMRMFHQTTAATVKQAALQTPSLSRIASMLNSEVVLLALNNDTHALSSATLSAQQRYNDTHAKLEPTSRIKNKDEPVLNAQAIERYNDTHAKLEPTTRIKNKDEPVLNAQAIAQLTPCSNSTTSYAIAAIYVWLGSSMGANIIVRRLEAMTLDIPTEYYQAMAGCAKAWVSFKQEVEILLPELGLDNESFVKNAVQDANAWFEFLISLGKRTAPNATPYHEASV